MGAPHPSRRRPASIRQPLLRSASGTVSRVGCCSSLRRDEQVTTRGSSRDDKGHGRRSRGRLYKWRSQSHGAHLLAQGHTGGSALESHAERALCEVGSKVSSLDASIDLNLLQSTATCKQSSQAPHISIDHCPGHDALFWPRSVCTNRYLSTWPGLLPQRHVCRCSYNCVC